VADPKQQFKMEYEHHKLAPGVHYGKHKAFGRHLAIGEGPNTIHIYPSRIFIGGSEGENINLTPRQMLIAARIINRIENSLGPKPKTENA
jgi:hypothetical protein